jgi:amino acid adenylation domain-containing protein
MTTVPELVCRQAERTPDAVAVRSGDTVLTYGELLDAAAQVAGRLTAEGIGPGAVVGLCAPRGPELVTAVLGILLSGAAYVPLDPEHPKQRLRSMLVSAGAALLLTDDVELDCPLPVRPLTGEAAPVDWRRYASGDEVAAGVCCVIFTSGSTGEPKGVEITHAGLANRLTGMLAEHGVGPDDVLLQKTPCTFDVSMWELLLAFLAGGTLVIAPPGAHRDPQALVELIVRHGVTMVHFVPSMLALFVTEPEAGRCGSLRMVLCGGEALPPTLANTLMDVLPHAVVYNMYGPAEATIDVTAWRCRRPERGDTVPIGRPLSHVVAYVVDGQGSLTPPGVAGELLLGGDCLARGYAGRPGLTAERFVLTRVAGREERVYRTGDQVRWTADGCLEYLGRIDTQVKIRGQRVELGEIESVLRRHPTVGNAVAVLRNGRLVAYVVSEQDESSLRAYLAERLPDHMVPARIVALTEIPTGPHGKADRSALPPPPRRHAADRTRHGESTPVPFPR